MWVKFYGTNQLGTVNKKQNWVDISETALVKFMTAKNLKNKQYRAAINEFLTLDNIRVRYREVLDRLGLLTNTGDPITQTTAYHKFQGGPQSGHGAQTLHDPQSDGAEQAQPLHVPQPGCAGQALTARSLAFQKHTPRDPRPGSRTAHDPQPGLAAQEKPPRDPQPGSQAHTARDSLPVCTAQEQTPCDDPQSESDAEPAHDEPLSAGMGKGQQPQVPVTASSPNSRNKVNDKKSFESKKRNNVEIIKNKEKRARKTLQEDQIEVSKKFHEKIIDHNPGFTCRLCKFSTGILLKAKTHAVSCGETRKKSLKKKELPCSECELKFRSKKALVKHFRQVHQMSSYKCSKCSKSYKNRKSYTLHLKQHDTEFVSKFQCDHCNYKTRDNWCLNRHKELKHPNKIHNMCLNIINEIITMVQEDNTRYILELQVNVGESIEEDTNPKEASRVNLNDNDLVIVDDEVNNDASNYVDISGDSDTVSDDSDDSQEMIREHTPNGISVDYGDMLSGDLDDVVSVGDLSENPSKTLRSLNEIDSEGCSMLIGQNRELCQYELIRLDIIKEREKLIAESNVLNEIQEAKNGLNVGKKVRKNRDKNVTKNKENDIIRRSDRVKHRDCNTSQDEEHQKASQTDFDLEIKIEIKEEVEDQINPTGANESVKDFVINKRHEPDDSEGNHLEEEIHETETNDEVNELPVKEKTVDKLKKFTCDLCDHSTVDNHHLKRHRENMHSPVEIKCLMCGVIFTEKFAFKQHLKTCFYVCPYSSCQKKFKNSEKFVAHKRCHVKMLRRLI